MKRVITSNASLNSVSVKEFRQFLQSYGLKSVVSKQNIYGVFHAYGSDVYIRFNISPETSKVQLDSLLLKNGKLIPIDDFKTLVKIIQSIESKIQNTEIINLYSFPDRGTLSKGGVDNSDHPNLIKIKGVTFNVNYLGEDMWSISPHTIPADNPSAINRNEIQKAIDGDSLFKGIATKPYFPDGIFLTAHNPTVDEIKNKVLNTSSVWDEIEQLKDWVAENTAIYDENYYNIFHRYPNDTYKRKTDAIII